MATLTPAKTVNGIQNRSRDNFAASAFSLPVSATSFEVSTRIRSSASACSSGVGPALPIDHSRVDES
jgi:hypothetical protein